MKLTRPKRIALELLGPPLLGAIPFILVSLGSALWEAEVMGKMELVLPALQMAASVLIIAYLFVGIQSILYTAIMEWCFSRGLDPLGWRSVGFSSLLGFASGAAVALADFFNRSDTLYMWLLWGGLGLAVGFIMGLLIKVWSGEKSAIGESQP